MVKISANLVAVEIPSTAKAFISGCDPSSDEISGVCFGQ
jgi:hypothetical protein